jgi:hypothetical protein
MSSPRELFARQVEQHIRKAFPGASIRPHPEAFGFLVQGKDGQERTLFLDNVFAETREMSPAERQARIERVVRSLSAPTGDTVAWDEARSRLVPLLRTSSMFANLGRLGANAPLRRPFAPFLVECVGLDSDDAISYVGPSAISAWGVELPEVFETATRNAAEYFRDDVEPFDPQAPYPVWYVARDDSYEASRLLVPGWLASFAGKVKGRPVAIVPTSTYVVVGGDGDERCLRRLIDSARAEHETSPRSISPALYTVDDGGRVVPLVLPPRHPLAADVARGHVMMAIGEYAAQRKPLQEAVSDEDLFVAEYTGVEKDGHVFSMATWSKGIPTLLPQADQVVFLVSSENEGDDLDMFRVPWDRVMELAGDCLQILPELDPPRWQTTGWPSDAVVAKLRGAAVP